MVWGAASEHCREYVLYLRRIFDTWRAYQLLVILIFGEHTMVERGRA